MRRSGPKAKRSWCKELPVPRSSSGDWAEAAGVEGNALELVSGWCLQPDSQPTLVLRKLALGKGLGTLEENWLKVKVIPF